MSDRADIRELHNQEAVPDAVFNIQQGSTARKRAAENIRRQQSSDNPRNIIESLSPEPPPLEALHFAIERNIDADRSTGVRVKAPEQIDRINRANAAAELAHSVLERGYPNLTEGQKRQVRERVLPEMQRLWPSINTAFGSMNRSERLRAMDDVLTDPHFQLELKRIIDDLQTRTIDGDSGEKSVYDQAKEALEEKQLEQADIRHRYRDAEGDKFEFDTSTVPPGRKGQELVSLGSLSVMEGEHVTVSEELNSLTSMANSLEEKRRRLATKLDGLTPGNANYTATENQLNAITQQLTNLVTTEIPPRKRRQQDLSQSIARKKELQEEKEKVEKDEKELWLQKEKIDREVDKLRKKMLSSLADKDLAKLGRGAREEAYVQEFQRSFAKAAEQVVRMRIQEADQARSRVADDTTSQAVRGGLQKRWVERDGKLDKKAIRRDYDRLIHDELDEVVKDALQAQGGMRSRADIEYKLSTDKEYAKNARQETAQKILERHLQTGGKLKPDEARKLADSDLGLEIASEAFAKNAELQGKLNDLQDKNKVPKNWNWKTTLTKLPRPTRRQMITAGLVGAGVFFGAPFIMPILDRAFEWGAENWKDYVATGDFPDVVDNIPENISDGVDTVQAEVNEFRENLSDDAPPPQE